MEEALIVSHMPHVVRHLTAGFDDLLVPYRVIDRHVFRLPRARRGIVFCMDARVAAELPRLPGPTVVVLAGVVVPDEVIPKLRGAHVSTLRVAAITPPALLQALISASMTDFDTLARRLRGIALFQGVPRGVIPVFLRNPAGMSSLTDLRRAMAPLSRDRARELVRSTGFDRAEHLFTALRCASWILLMEQGLRRRSVERYLGMDDRSSFRRSCRRAGVPSVRRGLTLDDLLAVAQGACSGVGSDSKSVGSIS